MTKSPPRQFERRDYKRHYFGHLGKIKTTDTADRPLAQAGSVPVAVVHKGLTQIKDS